MTFASSTLPAFGFMVPAAIEKKRWCCVWVYGASSPWEKTMVLRLGLWCQQPLRKKDGVAFGFMVPAALEKKRWCCVWVYGASSPWEKTFCTKIEWWSKTLLPFRKKRGFRQREVFASWLFCEYNYLLKWRILNHKWWKQW